MLLAVIYGMFDLILSSIFLSGHCVLFLCLYSLATHCGAFFLFLIYFFIFFKDNLSLTLFLILTPLVTPLLRIMCLYIQEV